MNNEHNEFDFKDLGKQINRTVNDALSSANLQELKHVRDSINASFQNAGFGKPKEKQAPSRQTTPNYNYTQVVTHHNKDRSLVQHWPKKDSTGNAGGIVLSIFGALFLVPGAGYFFSLLLSSIGTPIVLADILLPFIGYSFVFLVGGTMLGCGSKLIHRATRYTRYQRAIGSSSFCTIDSLAQAVGRSPKFVRKDLKKMVQRGLFPGARFDHEETCFILNDETYRQYLLAQESRRLREQKEEERRLRAEKYPEIIAVMEEGEKYLKSIREANDALPGVEISNKLYRLEEIAAKIFNYVEQHPNKLPDIRRFMNYYLPTSLKLVKAYREFDEQPVQGENLTAIKQEILETLDTINLAYENLLDRLFEDNTLDIATDISALETMLAQEGLTGDNFNR